MLYSTLYLGETQMAVPYPHPRNRSILQVSSRAGAPEVIDD